MSLIEQLRNFSDASDGLLGDISNEELTVLTDDLNANLSRIWEYIETIDADAERLGAKAKAYADSARVQKNKSARLRDFIKYALRSNGFTKFKSGDLRFSIAAIKKQVPKRPATADDWWSLGEAVDVGYSWKRLPVVDDFIDDPESVHVDYSFNVEKLKELKRDDLLETQVSERLTVKLEKI